MTQDDLLYQQVAKEVTRRIHALEAAGEVPVNDALEITSWVVRRLEMRRPNLPHDSPRLRQLVEAEVTRSIREDRKQWAATHPAIHEPSETVLRLLKRGMRTEAIKRYCLESGQDSREAREMVSAFARVHGIETHEGT